MKNSIQTCVLAAVGLLAVGAVSLQAQTRASDNHFYFTTDFGVSLIDAVDLTQFGLAVPNPTPPPATIAAPAGGQALLNPGLRFDASAGYEISLSKASCVNVEIASGLIFNGLDQVEFPALKVGMEGDWQQVPLLANVIFHYHLANGITPYLGGGGGVIFSLMNLETLSLANGTTLSAQGSDEDVVGAFQGVAGVQFEISDNTSVGLGYKFLTTSGPTWNLGGGRVELDDVRVHAVSMTLTYRF